MGIKDAIAVVHRASLASRKNQDRIERLQKVLDDAKAKLDANSMRTCADCGADISERNGNAKRCQPCAKKRIRLRHMARSREYFRRWYVKNKAAVQAKNRAWAAAHPERVKELSAAWIRANKKKMQEKYRARYATKRAAEMAADTRVCVDCNEVSLRGRAMHATMCRPCARERHLSQLRAYARARYAATKAQEKRPTDPRGG